MPSTQEEDIERYQRALFLIVKDKKTLEKPCREVDVSNLHDRQCAEHVIRELIEVAEDLQLGKDLTCWGLAANQRGFDLRVFVVWDDKKERFASFINPEIIHKTKRFAFDEGCYSFPGKTASVVRYKEIKVRDHSGKIVKLRGMQAVAFQHEMDHIDGICI